MSGTTGLQADKAAAVRKKHNFFVRLRKEKYLQIMALAGVAYILVFNYAPMFGLIIGFKNYQIHMGIKGMFTSQWVGLKHFREFFTYYDIGLVLRNTFMLSALKMIFSFPVPILFAIMICEVSSLKFRKLVQTASYLPHFIGWVTVSGIITAFFSGIDGVFNNLLLNLKLIDSPLDILTNPNKFYALAVLSDIWKSFGWWSIIFIAAITGVDPTQYESAIIDGAGRIQRIWYITLPGIKGAIAVVLIMAMGHLLGGGLSGSNFEQSMLLGNNLNYDRSMILQKYALQSGLEEMRYSYATAIGLMESTLSVILVYTTNRLAKKLSGSGLF